jgi:hypothetical protein
MLTWEWVTHPKHALAARPADSPWAGRFWYSFYERGAIMADFCQRALAYMTDRPLEEFARKKTAALAQSIRRSDTPSLPPSGHGPMANRMCAATNLPEPPNCSSSSKSRSRTLRPTTPPGRSPFPGKPTFAPPSKSSGQRSRRKRRAKVEAGLPSAGHPSGSLGIWPASDCRGLPSNPTCPRPGYRFKSSGFTSVSNHYYPSMNEGEQAPV